MTLKTRNVRKIKIANPYIDFKLTFPKNHKMARNMSVIASRTLALSRLMTANYSNNVACRAFSGELSLSYYACCVGQINE